ncbi:hypothetical protein NKI56_33665, partial [Mesorhizobium sp. M0622]
KPLSLHQSVLQSRPDSNLSWRKLPVAGQQPFKSAEAFSQAHTPDVPPIEYLPIQPVPALTDDYAQAGHPAEDAGAPTTGMADSEKGMSSPFNGAAVIPTVAATMKAAPATKEPATRTANHKASLPQPKRAKADLKTKRSRQRT